MVRRGWRNLGACLLALSVGACSVAPADEPAARVEGLPTSTPAPWTRAMPETQGLDSLILADVLEGMRDEVPGVHAAVLARGGAIVLDATFYPYDGTTPHAVGSITKIVTTALLGIVADRGLLSLDDPVLPFFPEHDIAGVDPQMARVTLRHLATMTSGLDCSAADDEAELAAMTASDDWVAFALDLPMVDEPGTTFRYCSPGTHLLAAVIERVTSVSLLDSARQFLFEPLGISAVRWSTDPQGVTYGFGGLYLHPVDLAKLGQLWAAGGRWDGHQLVPASWAREMTTARITTGGSEAYAVGWWVPREEAHGAYRARGHGGQLLMVRPDLDLVAVVAGSGVVPDAVVDRLMTALTSEDRSLMADDLGERRLAVVLGEVREPTEAVRPSGPKSTIAAISGVTWQLEANPCGLTTVRIDLKGKDREGVLRLGFTDGSLLQPLPVGLDGAFRIGLDRHRRPVASRGSWATGRTLVLEVDEITDGRAYTLRLVFPKAADSVTVEGQERGHDSGFVVEGAPAE